MKKIISTVLCAILLVSALSTVVSAAPYATYTYSAQGQVLTSPAAYVPDAVVDSAYMGLGNTVIDDPRDLFVGPDLRVYIVDAANNRVVVLDRYYKLLFTINTFTNEHGVPDSFNNPSGVFANETNIYVCDTDNNRIIMFDTEGNYLKIIPKPESSLFEEGSIYKPIACVADDYGRLFVVSSTTYQGIIVLNDNGDFYGFIGAQKVTISALQILWRRIQTDEQREQSEEYVSTEFNNISIDKDNFIYVTTSSIQESQQQGAINSKSKSSDYAPVKKLNASGADVMKRNGFYPPSGEVRITNLSTANIAGASKIIDAATGPEGTWSIIDEKRSKVFTYNDNGDLLFVFGDIGQQTGNIQSIEAIAYQGDKILLLDKTADNFVVYRRTEYADLLIAALEHNNNRQYDVTVDDWTEILKRNNNFDSAYIQIGKSLYRQGKYEEAMDYYKSAFETENYSEAYKEIRKNWANKFFWLIPIVIVVFFILLGKFFGFAGKVNKRTALKVGRKSLKEELLYAFHVILHPFDGFWDLKHEQRGSVKAAFVILLITILAYFYRTIGTGYIFNPRPSTSFNIMGAMTAVLAPLLLWVVANWCLTTLFEGEGSMSDIFTACCYALTPLPLIIIPVTIISNFLTQTEGGIITMLESFAYIWMGILVFFGMMVTHDYSVGKNILTCIATIVGMAFIMFIGVLFSSLMAKIVSFVTNIINEISYRV
ncbi:MAG: YIP1 family protein [Clostridia bacterium]|nr:YIP1 family protein [Clostridia bacterium]MBO7403368.1 YIP1 family protein [Clostridia bacterium]